MRKSTFGLLLAVFAVLAVGGQGFMLPWMPDGDVMAGMVFRYCCNEGTGSLLGNSGGSANAALTGSPTWGTGLNALPCITFNGGTTQGAMSSASLAASGDCTICAWVNPSSGNSTFNRIVDNNFSTGFTLCCDATGTKFQTIFNNPAVGTLTSAAFTNGQWCFVLATYLASSDTATLYIGGASVGSATMGSGHGIAATTVNIGSNNIANVSAPSCVFHGSIQDARGYNRVITTAEIATLTTNGPR